MSINARAGDENTQTTLHPIEQTLLIMQSKVFSGFAWYEMDLHLNRDLENAVILIEMQKGNALYIFIDDEFIEAMDNHEHAKGNITLLAFLGMILASQHMLLILLESLGCHNLIGR